jgi:hypothetical protein
VGRNEIEHARGRRDGRHLHEVGAGRILAVLAPEGLARPRDLDALGPQQVDEVREPAPSPTEMRLSSARHATWRDAAEFIALGSTTVQVCTAVMHYGFRIVEQLISGLENWMREKKFNTGSLFLE